MKGALFARYSRSDKSLRRLFLDEFVGDLDLTGDLTVDATVGLKRAEELYERVFFEYGDDSVAQLGGVHLACEQASNLLTKILEWGRLMAYLEQSTRYIPYDSRLQRPLPLPAARREVCASPLGTRYVADLDALFDTYSALLPAMMDWARERYPKEPGDSDFVYKQTIKAKACDTRARPAARRDALERRHLRHRPGVRGAAAAHARPPAARGADVRAADARRAAQGHPVVPRPRRPPRPRRRVDRRTSPRPATTPPTSSQRLFGDERARARPTRSRSLDWDPDGEDKVLAAICYPHTHLPEAQLLERVRRLAGRRSRRADARVRRRAHATGATSPAARSSAPAYRFDVLGDYGAFRDLQRHRMLTIEWQQLTPHHGYEMPEPVREAGLARALRRRDGTIGRAATTRSSSRSRSRPRTRSRSATACAT